MNAMVDTGLSKDEVAIQGTVKPIAVSVHHIHDEIFIPLEVTEIMPASESVTRSYDNMIANEQQRISKDPVNALIVPQVRHNIRIPRPP